MLSNVLNQDTPRAALLVLALSLAATTVQAQQSDHGVIAASDTATAAKLEARAKDTRTRHLRTNEQRAPIGLLPLLRARGIRHPLIVLNGRVTSQPVPSFVRADEIECVEFRPGPAATLEFRRGHSDRGADGVLIIWTRGSIGRKPPGCRIPY